MSKLTRAATAGVSSAAVTAVAATDVLTVFEPSAVTYGIEAVLAGAAVATAVYLVDADN